VRSCEDHNFTLTSIYRNLNNANINTSTFTCFVNMQKTFDRVNGEIVYMQLANIRVIGNLLVSITIEYKLSSSRTL